jgi:hypothetical protein
MTAVLAFFLSPLGRSAAIAVVLAGSFFWWLHNHDQRVTERVVINIDKANDNATNLGSSAAAASADKRVRGRRDPTTRND